MLLRKINEAVVNNKRVLVRCGFDIPFDEKGGIADDVRIVECLETIRFLLKKHSKIIICSHNGRPEGKIIPKLSMDKVAVRLKKLLNHPVIKLQDCIGPEVERRVKTMNAGEIILLENLRFHPEEEKNNKKFATQLARLGDIYINEAFANLHRRHASMVAVAELLPAFTGFRLQKEIEVLTEILKNPTRPLVAIIGGAKISDKIRVIRRFLDIADHVLLGGALANTILKVQGISIGKSFVENEMMSLARSLPLISTKLHVPVDVVTAREATKNAKTENRAVGGVANDEYIYDIGPDTIKLFSMIIKNAGTIVWGGPMGYFELKPFAKGTIKLAKIIASSRAFSLVGGGDTVDAVDMAGCREKISFISTGGGAMLEFIEGKKLPALQALIRK